MTDNPDKTPVGNETQIRVRPISIRKVLGAFMLVVLAIVIVNSVINANQNFINRFKEGFYFEKYSDAKEARAALLKLHPIGSDMAALHRSLKSAGAYGAYYPRSPNEQNEVKYGYQQNIGSMFYEYRWGVTIEVDCTSFCSYGAVIKNIEITKREVVPFVVDNSRAMLEVVSEALCVEPWSNYRIT